MLEFLPDHDWEGDLEFNKLRYGLRDKDVEYCKARVVSSSATRAMLRIIPEEITNKQAKDMATNTPGRYEKSPKCQLLIDYLRKLHDTDLERKAQFQQKPLTRDEILLKLETAFRESSDDKTTLDLGREIIKLRGYDRQADTSRTDDVEIPQEFLDSLGQEAADDGD